MQGKIAFVTGASSGIVLATSKLLTSINPTVALVAHSTDKLDSFAAEVFANDWMKNILGKRIRVMSSARLFLLLVEALQTCQRENT